MKSQTAATQQYLPATWKGGYFPVPHALRQLLSRNRINGMIQMQILLEIAGEQARCGEGGKPAKWASGLTVSKLAIACGRKPERLPDGTVDQAIRGVEKALADLVSRGMVQREKDGRSWRYSISPNDWRDAPRYIAEAPQDSTDEPQDPDETADAKPETIRKSAGTLVVLPGKQSRPFTLASAVQKVSFQSELSAAFECDLAVLEDGNLNVRIYESTEKTASMESTGYAGNTRPLGGQSEALPEAEEKAKPVNGYIGQGDPLRDYAVKVLAPLTGDLPTEIVLSATRSHLGNTPIEYLADRVRAKGAKYNSHRLLPHLATDAAERYQAERQREKTLDSKPVESERKSTRESEEPESSAWGKVLSKIRTQITPASFQNWLARTRLLTASADELVVCVPDTATEKWLSTEYRDLVFDAIRATLKSDVSIRWVSRHMEVAS